MNAKMFRTHAAVMNDSEEAGRPEQQLPLIPAQAGIQRRWNGRKVLPWVPAFAGTSGGWMNAKMFRTHAAMMNDSEEAGRPEQQPPLIPAQAGIRGRWNGRKVLPWVPAFAGTSGGWMNAKMFRTHAAVMNDSEEAGRPEQQPPLIPAQAGIQRR